MHERLKKICSLLCLLCALLTPAAEKIDVARRVRLPDVEIRRRRANEGQTDLITNMPQALKAWAQK